MTIRRLGESDVHAWWALRLKSLETEPLAFGKSPGEHRETPMETFVERFRGSNAHNFTLGAFDGEVLVGMATYVRGSGLKDRHKGNIYGVFVDGSYRGRG